MPRINFALGISTEKGASSIVRVWGDGLRESIDRIQAENVPMMYDSRFHFLRLFSVLNKTLKVGQYEGHTGDKGVDRKSAWFSQTICSVSCSNGVRNRLKWKRHRKFIGSADIPLMVRPTDCWSSQPLHIAMTQSVGLDEVQKIKTPKKTPALWKGKNLRNLYWRGDSNPWPPDPQSGALTNWATPA